MHHSHTETSACGNDAAASPLPPYRGFRHQVQPRNAELATAVEIFFRLGDWDRLVATVAAKSPGERVMVVIYLLANDMAACAGELADRLGLDLVIALGCLDSANGREVAEALGWSNGAHPQVRAQGVAS